MAFPWLAAAMVASSAMSTFGRKKEGGMEQGYDVVTMPQYSFTEPRLRLASDYLTQNIERMARGEYPAWYDRAQPVMREGMRRGLTQATYGRPGERTGALQQAQDVGAITGIGPKATWAQGRKVLSDYMDKSSQIDEYLTSLGVDIMRGGEQTYLQASQGMPQGPQAAIVNKMGGVYGPQGPSPWQTLAQTGAGMLGGMDWSKMFQPQIPQGATGYGGGAWGMSTPYTPTPGMTGWGNYAAYQPNITPSYLSPMGLSQTQPGSQYNILY